MNKPTTIMAFPCVTERDVDRGISLRDYFAAKAMQGLLAKGFTDIKQEAYIIADSMLEAREKL